MNNSISLSENEKAELQAAFDLIDETVMHERPIVYGRLAKKLGITKSTLKDCYARFQNKRISDRRRQEGNSKVKKPPSFQN